MTPTSTKPKRADPGQRAVNFFAKRLHHVNGAYAGAPFTPARWQEQWLRDIFGTLRPDGRRQYRTAYLEIPKKNGKTTMIAGVLAKMLYDEGEFGAEVYSAAATREQAGMTYRILASMVRQSPRLLKVQGKAVKLYDRDKRIYIPATESFFQALSADAGYNDGINPSAAVIDELHRHRNGDLLAIIDEGMGTRSQPLLVVITTAGGERVGVCWDWHEYARKVIEGIVSDHTFHATIYAAADDANPWSEKTWKACNPALKDGVLDLEDFRKAARKAKEMSSAEINFRRLRLNQWIAAASKWLNRVHWDACGGVQPTDSDLEDRPCFGGIDLGETDDFSALVLVFPQDGERYDVRTRLYLPEAAIDKHKDVAAQLRRWAREGFVTLVPGETMDDETILRDVLEAAGKFGLCEIGYDPWKMKKLARRLEDEGITMVPVAQSPRTMSEPCRWLETLLAEGRINHGGNPVLRWMADNAVVRRDVSGNIRPDKDKSSEKIDGIVALVVALERTMNQQQKRAFAGVVT